MAKSRTTPHRTSAIDKPERCAHAVAPRCRIGRAAMLAMLLGVLSMPNPVAADDQNLGPFELTLSTLVGAPAGFVKVGEFDRSGAALHFQRDLGIDTFETVQGGVVYHLTPADALRARFDYTFLYGGTTLDRDTAYNGALLAGDTHVSSRPLFGRVLGFYDHRFVDAPNGFRLYGGLGLTYTYLEFKLHGTLAPTTVGHETTEDFYAQELPVPLGVLHADYPINDRLSLTGWADGGALPRVDSLRTEGGQVTLTQGHADLFLGVRYAVTDAFSVDGGYSFTYFAQHQISGEDNNEILFFGHGFGLNLAYRF
jgi:opacity protein-like surface antigen